MNPLGTNSFPGFLASWPPERCLQSRAVRASGGFSLVEVLCALVVLGVGVVGVTEGITGALHSSKEAEVHTTAALLASGRIELLRAEGFFTSGETEGTFGDDFPQYHWRETITGTNPPGLHEVVVAIERGAAREKVLELRTLLFKQPLELGTGDETDQTKRDPRKRR